MGRLKLNSKVGSLITFTSFPPLTNFTDKVSTDPFDALPSELIIKILKETRTTSVPILFPLMFLRVCRRWRSIVLATPNLWKDVYIPGKGDSRGLEVTRLFVERSRPYPMTLTWDHRPWNHDFVVQHILRPGFDRWQVITIASSTFISRDFLCTILPNLSFPSLQYLKCKTLQSHSGSSADHIPEVTINAPNLRHWTSINHILPSAYSSTCLTTLDFTVSGHSECFSVKELLALLRAASRTLRHLKLVARDTPFDNRILDTSKTRLSKLEVLELHNSSALLQWVLTPNLRTLCLHGGKENAAIPFSSVLGPTLIHLKLSMLPLHHLEDDPDFSFRFPGLETITFFSCKDTPSAFSHAVPRRPGCHPFPSLRSITFSDAEALPSIRFMLEGSKISDPSASSLEKLRLVYRGGPSPRSGDVEWILAQGIEFLGGREFGEPWSDPAFDDEWAVL